MLRLARALLVTAGLAALVSCGHARVRTSQDWSAVTDARLLRTCQVTDFGSGVCIARDASGLYVLANQHVVGGNRSVSVHLPVGEPAHWQRFEARVLATSNRIKYDLALLLIEDPPPGEPFDLRLAPDLATGERRDGVELMVVSSRGAPLVYTGSLVERSVLWAGPPDETGATVYPVSMVCLFGGIQQANSGSPLFQGDLLIGLDEISPYEAELVTHDVRSGEHRETVVGVGVSTPTRIRGFLRAVGYGHLIADPERQVVSAPPTR